MSIGGNTDDHARNHAAFWDGEATTGRVRGTVHSGKRSELQFRLVPVLSDLPARHRKNRKPCGRNCRIPSGRCGDASLAYQLTFVDRKTDLPSRVS